MIETSKIALGSLLECKPAHWLAIWNVPNAGADSGAEVTHVPSAVQMPFVMFLGESKVATVGSSPWLHVLTIFGAGWMREACFKRKESQE